jgi:MFS family permease
MPPPYSMLSEYRGIPAQAKLLIYLSFMPSIAFGFIYTDLSYFLHDVQGILPFWLGIVLTTMAISLVVTSVPLGILADRYGRRNMLIVGNVSASISLIGFALTKNVVLLLMVAVVEGVGEAAFAVSTSALLADKAGNAKRTPAFSLQALLSWIGGAIGSFAISSVSVMQNFGLNTREAHMALYVVVGLLSLSVTPLVLRIHEEDSEGLRRAPREGILPRKSMRILLRYLLCNVTIAFGAGLFVPLMTFWFSSVYSVSDAVSGPVLGFSSILTAFAVFMSPRLANRFGIVKAIVLTQGLSTVFMAAVPFSPSFGIAATVYTMRVLLMNLSNPLTQSLIMGLVEPEERGMASGFNAALWRLPNAFSSALGAVLIGEGLAKFPFYIATVLYVAAISGFWFLFKDARLPEEAIVLA